MGRVQKSLGTSGFDWNHHSDCIFVCYGRTITCGWNEDIGSIELEIGGWENNKILRLAGRFGERNLISKFSGDNYIIAFDCNAAMLNDPVSVFKTFNKFSSDTHRSRYRSKLYMRKLKMVTEKPFTDNQVELRYVFVLFNESKVIFTLSEQMGAVLVTFLKFLIESFPNLTRCRFPKCLFWVNEMITRRGPV